MLLLHGQCGVASTLEGGQGCSLRLEGELPGLPTAGLTEHPAADVDAVNERRLKQEIAYAAAMQLLRSCSCSCQPRRPQRRDARRFKFSRLQQPLPRLYKGATGNKSAKATLGSPRLKSLRQLSLLQGPVRFDLVCEPPVIMRPQKRSGPKMRTSKCFWALMALALVAPGALAQAQAQAHVSAEPLPQGGPQMRPALHCTALHCMHVAYGTHGPQHAFHAGRQAATGSLYQANCTCTA
jgi:hypothetical protein